MFAERIDEVRDKIFFFGTSFEDFFLIFNNNFVVGNFDDFAAVDDEFGVDEAFDDGAFDDDLLDGEIFGSEGEIDDFAEFGAFLGFDFETDKVEVESKDVFDFDDVFGADEFVGVVDDHAKVGIFADGSGV